MKRIGLGLASLVGAIAVMALGSGSAMAAGTAATCALEGQTTSLTPPVQFMNGTGSYSFSGQAACQIQGSPGLHALTSSGTYSNIVCGTGTADGTATIDGFGTRAYHIQFVSGVGLVTVNGAPAGHVTIIPTAFGAPGQLNDCVTQFTVAGSFSVD